MYEEYGSHGFVPVTVNLQESMETVRLYARQATHPYLRDNGSVWPVYSQHNAIPTNYVVDSGGVIRYVAEGFDEAAIRQVVRQWLPDPIEHDVGATYIASPAGNIDSALTVTPACSVYNYGEQIETYPVRLRIGTGYDTVATVADHAPGTARYVEFPVWTALERGQLAITCTTELAGDDITNNDRRAGLVTVNVFDLAVTAILAPSDTVDSAAAVVPMAEVRNLGTVGDMVRVRFAIGTVHSDEVNVPLQPGRCDTAVFEAWTPHEVGTFEVRCSVSGRWEMVPENNQLTDTVYVVSVGIGELPGGRAGPTQLEIRPNPAGVVTTVRYSLARPELVGLRVYSAEGELVRTLVAGPRPAGVHTAVWDGRDATGRPVGCGVYYCWLDVRTEKLVRKLIKSR